jgi:hypothetical protein
MAGEPGAHLGVLVGGVVVDNGVDDLADRNLRFDLVEEADELLMPVALHATADHRSVQDIERREQGGRAVALVIVGHGPSPPLLQGKPRLGAVQGLDLALLVHRQNHRVGGRIDIEADDIGELLEELRVLRQLEGSHPVGREAMRFPDALNADHADADGLGHGAGGPVRGLPWRIGQGQLDNPGNGLGRQRRLARLAGLVAQQTIEALAHEPLLPAPDSRLGQTRAAHDLVRATAFGRGRQRPGARDMLLRTIAVADDDLQPAAIIGRDRNGDTCSHAHSMHRFGPSGNPLYGPIH